MVETRNAVNCLETVASLRRSCAPSIVTGRVAVRNAIEMQQSIKDDRYRLGRIGFLHFFFNTRLQLTELELAVPMRGRLLASQAPNTVKNAP